MPGRTQDRNKDALLIYGQGWMFGVIEPKGWRCHTKDAYKYTMNAYFCLGKKNIDNSPAIMHISVYDKGGRTMEENLAIDIKNYKKHHKKVELSEFLISGLTEEFASRILIYDEKTTDYVCFLDPDKNSPLYLVFVLHGPNDVSPKYEMDFLSLIGSLHWLGGDAKGIKK
jgi:hypothetical protein